LRPPTFGPDVSPSALGYTVTAFATPYRERTLQLLEERTELEAILRAGAEQAREVASATVAEVYRKVGLLAARPAAQEDPKQTKGMYGPEAVASARAVAESAPAASRR
jgi:hypothetical protein